MPDRYFLVNDRNHAIPEERVQEFLTDFPDAEEMKFFKAKGKTYRIPVTETENFVNDFPSALEVSPIKGSGPEPKTKKPVEPKPEPERPQFLKRNELDEAFSEAGRKLFSFDRDETGKKDLKSVLGSTLIADMIDRGLSMSELSDIGNKEFKKREKMMELGAAGMPPEGIAEATKDMGMIPEDFERINELNAKIQRNKPALETTKYAQAETIKDKLHWFFKAPHKVAADIMGESMVALFDSGKEELIGGGLLSAFSPYFAAAATGLASYRLEAGQTFVTALQEAADEAGLDLTKPEDFEKFFTDSDTVDRARQYAQARGLSIGLFEAVGAGIAGKILGPIAKSGFTKKVGLTGKALGVESLAGGLGEASAEITSGEELDPLTIFDETFMELGPGSATIAYMGGVEAARRVTNKVRHGLTFTPDLAASVAGGDEEGFKSRVREARLLGQISVEDEDRIISEYDEFKKFNETIPEDVTDKQKRARILEKIRERTEIENKKVDPAFEDKREEDIKKVNQEIKNIVKEKDVPAETGEFNLFYYDKIEDVPDDQLDFLDQTITKPDGTKQIQVKVPKPEPEPETFEFFPDNVLEGKEIEIEVENASTGKKQKIKMDAGEAQNEIKASLQKLKLLKDCLKQK